MVSKTEEIKRDKELVRKIKPKLRKFVIKNQQDRAIKAAQEVVEQRKVLIQESLITRGCEIAYIAMVKNKIWERYPSYFEMKWARTIIVTEADRRERDLDVAGFGSYLAREYINYVKLKDSKKGYPNPMNEENITFFWLKFNADLRLLIKADKLRVAAGNKGVIISNESGKSN